jgi:hypothetical protein
MDQLKRLGLEKGKKHEYFGDWEKTLQTFIKQGYHNWEQFVYSTRSSLLNISWLSCIFLKIYYEKEE